tara:strand:+ start:92217 stop:95513 length:3297 start_codon:yes stop_codon:yes gene_type:complete
MLGAVTIIWIVATTLFAIYFAADQKQTNYRQYTSQLTALSSQLEINLLNETEKLRRDTLFLARAPATRGITRSSADGLLDPVTNITHQNWIERLQFTFVQILSINPNYYQARYIGAAQDGKEIIRVESADGEITIISEENLQPKGPREYFQETRLLPVDAAYFSRIDLNAENGGIIEEPARPTIRSATPVYADNGEFFGIIVLNYNISSAFEGMAEYIDLRSEDSALQIFVTNSDGEYLFHPDRSKTFAFMYDRSDRIQDDYSNIRIFDGTDNSNLNIADVTDNTLYEADSNDGPFYIFDKTVNLIPGANARELKIWFVLPESAIELGLLPLILDFWVSTVGIGLIILFVLLLLVARQLRTISSLSSTALKIAGGDYNVALPGANSKEVNNLINSLSMIKDGVARRENELREAINNADRLLQVKSDFLANMSHEIRTPMTAIMGLIDILRLSELDKRQQQYVHQIQSSSRSLLHIINDILDISKIEAGKVTLEAADFSLLEVLENSIDLFAPSADMKGVHIHLSMDTQINSILIGDRTRLTQILNNLLGNAVKFTEKGEIVLSATVLNRKDDSIKIRFSVVDTGMGISKEAMTRLFEAFEQADTSTTRMFGGSGLGLTISFKLVQLMNSTLQAKSILNEGSTFWFDATFPLSDKPELKLTNIEQIRKNVLVVDDQAISCEIISEMLSHWGCNVFTALSGPEALKKITHRIAKGDQFDFFVVDWLMPAMNGFQLIEKIQTLYETHHLQFVPPVLMVTGAERTEIEESDAFRDDIQVLQKPVTISKLLNTLAEMGVIKFIIEEREDSKREELEIELKAKISQLTQPPKILLVEDNITNQLVIQELLAQYGFNIIIANNGREGVEAVSREAVDLVFMDLQMPVMDGFEATIEIRKFKPRGTLPILALSAATFSKDIQSSDQAGMDDHLNKPIDVEKLLSALIKWLPLKTDMNVQASNKSKPAPAKHPLTSNKIEISGTENDNNELSAKSILANLEKDAGFDFSGTILSSTGAATLVRILQAFYEEFSDIFQSWESGADWNQEEQRRIAHSIKGSAHSIGALTLAKFAAATELEIKNGESTNLAILMEHLNVLLIRLSSVLP